MISIVQLWPVVVATLALVAGCRSSESAASTDLAVFTCPSELPQTTVMPSDMTIDFGAQPPGSVTTRSLTITNVGTIETGPMLGNTVGPFSISDNPDAGMYGFRPIGGTCPATLPPGASCTVDVAFFARARGDFLGSAIIAYGRGAFCQFPGGGGGGGWQGPAVVVQLSGSD